MVYNTKYIKNHAFLLSIDTEINETQINQSWLIN